MPLDTVIIENRESFSREIRLKIQIRESFFAKFHSNMVDLIMIYFCQVNPTQTRGGEGGFEARGSKLPYATKQPYTVTYYAPVTFPKIYLGKFWKKKIRPILVT